jgi:hypothetical protein
MEVGTVYVWHDEDLETLYVKYVITDDDWMISETHLAFGDELSDIPQTKTGNPIPGQFPYKSEHDPWVSYHLYEIDITGMFECDDMIYVAAHSVVYKDLGDYEYQTETGWTGEHEFDGRNWAVYFKYTFECEDEPQEEIATASFGYEDLPFEGYNGKTNDWDYNDFLVDMVITGGYNSDDEMEWIEFKFTADEKTADFTHDLDFKVPSSGNPLLSDGTFALTYYDEDGLIGSPTTSDYFYTVDKTWNIFSNTEDAINDGQYTVLKIEFTTSFTFNLNSVAFDSSKPHGSNLFFDVILKVDQTSEVIDNGDLRMVFVPEDWNDPDEGQAIWLAYPHDGGTPGTGVKNSGGEPDFYGDWYTV